MMAITWILPWQWVGYPGDLDDTLKTNVRSLIDEARRNTLLAYIYSKSRCSSWKPSHFDRLAYIIREMLNISKAEPEFRVNGVLFPAIGAENP